MKCWCGGDIVPFVSSDNLACVESEFHDPLATGRPTEVTKLYIAGPMSGYPDCNYPAFNQVAALLSSRYTVVNPADNKAPMPRSYTDLLRYDLRAMLDCHGVATLENWWESVGARNEVHVAGILKMPIRPWKEWLS